MKNFNLLNSSHQRQLLILIGVIAIFLALTYFVTTERGTAAAKGTNVAKSISRLSNDVSMNSPLYTMLENNKGAYSETNLLKGFDKDVYTPYFFRLKEKKLVTSIPAPLIAAPATVVAPVEPMRPNRLNFILITESGRYAYIDNERVTLGDTTPSGMKVIKIEDKRVLLEGKRSSEWVILKF